MNIANVGLSGLFAAQAGLDASARNTSNMLTLGYSRQGVLFTPRIGGGVLIGASMRFNSGYQSQQMWRSQSDKQHFASRESLFDQLENIVGMGDGSARQQVDAFFRALEAVTADPTNTALRQQVIASADALAKSVNLEREAMRRQLSTAQAQSVAGIEQANALARGIADLNRAIAEADALGLPAHELKDQRDQAIDDLSALVAIDVLIQPDGTADIALSGGPPLVTSGQSGQLALTAHADGSWQLDLDLAGGRYPIDGARAGGMLGGLVSFATETLMPTMATQADFASQFADAVNAQLAAGFDVNGVPGKPLFVYDPVSGMLAADMSITPAELGFSGAADQPGNNDNLLKIAGLRASKVTLYGLGEVALGDASTLMAGRIGSDSQANRLSLAKATDIRAQAELDRNALSGVSNEEETVRMMELIQMYQANMKVISTARELFDSTIQML